MTDRPRAMRHYANPVFESSRWDGFIPRPGDVVVCTSYKAGTTWTQMICALLIHRTEAFPAPLALISPWLDMRTEAIDVILGRLEAQTHRRLIKTHTALDGLPFFDEVTYLVCGRDPRDVFMSLQNHLDNVDPERFAAVMAAQGHIFGEAPALPTDIDERFKIWLTMSTFPWERDGLPFWSHFNHALTFWAERHRPNIHFLHYADLKADLGGQMRRIAGLLGITIEEALWPSLIRAASFADMKAKADRTAPDIQHGIWRDNSRFFNKGENAQWRGVLSDDSLALYDDVVRGRYPPVLVDWLEYGSLAMGDPKGL